MTVLQANTHSFFKNSYNMKSIHLILLSLIVIYSNKPGKAMSQEVYDDVCAVPESSQFDFWIGEWKATWVDQEGNTQTGKNLIRRILGGCTIEENFSTNDGSFIGRSYSVYNSRKGIWEQTWVDNSGSYLALKGGLEGEKMILSLEGITKEGKKVIQRMVFYDIKGDAFTWDWENSTDEGSTWNLQWRIYYTRIN